MELDESEIYFCDNITSGAIPYINKIIYKITSVVFILIAYNNKQTISSSVNRVSNKALLIFVLNFVFFLFVLIPSFPTPLNLFTFLFSYHFTLTQLKLYSSTPPPPPPNSILENEKTVIKSYQAFRHRPQMDGHHIFELFPSAFGNTYYAQ